MKIAVMGAGAVGSYYGARLAAAGHRLSFIARGKHLEAMQRNGLTVHSPRGDRRLDDALFTASPQEAGIADLILFCVKSYDTDRAVAALEPMVSRGTVILSLQNGVDNPEKIALRWGSERTYAGVIYIAAAVTAPGVIAHTAGGKIMFGPIGGAAAPRAAAIANLLSAAAIPCELRNDIERVQWSKLLWNAPFGAIACLAGADVQQIVESESLTRLALECMAEVQTAARCRGIDLPHSLLEETLAFSRGMGPFKPSMLQDLEAGKPLEYEAINGIVTKQLERAGHGAPVNRTFYSLLQFLDQKNRQEAKR